MTNHRGSSMRRFGLGAQMGGGQRSTRKVEQPHRPGHDTMAKQLTTRKDQGGVHRVHSTPLETTQVEKNHTTMFTSSASSTSSMWLTKLTVAEPPNSRPMGLRAGSHV